MIQYIIIIKRQRYAINDEVFTNQINIIMKYILFSLFVIIPFITFAQKKSKPVQQRPQNYGAGAGLIGLGGVLIAGSQIYLINNNGTDTKTTTTILSATGGVSILAGCILLANKLNKLNNYQYAKVRFTGNGFVVKL